MDDIVITETAQIKENFDDYESTASLKGTALGGPSFEITPNGYNSTKALAVKNRSQDYYGYQYDLAAFAGNKVKVTAKVTATSVTPAAISAKIKTTKKGQDDDYQTMATATVENSGEFVNLVGEYDVPAGFDTYFVHFEAPASVDYIIDDICFDIVGEYKKPETSAYVDTSEYPILKQFYDFKFGCTCEAISTSDNKLLEIGNGYKEALIKAQFNSITFGNELTPAYNMDFKNEACTETSLPFSINRSAKEMLDWAKEVELAFINGENGI